MSYINIQVCIIFIPYVINDTYIICKWTSFLLPSCKEKGTLDNLFQSLKVINKSSGRQSFWWKLCTLFEGKLPLKTEAKFSDWLKINIKQNQGHCIPNEGRRQQSCMEEQVLHTNKAHMSTAWIDKVSSGAVLWSLLSVPGILMMLKHLRTICCHWI